MKIALSFDPNKKTQIKIIAAFHTPSLNAKDKDGSLDQSHWKTSLKQLFSKAKTSPHFKGKRGEHFPVTQADGELLYFIGLGEKTKYQVEVLRREFSKILKYLANKTEEITLDLDSIVIGKDYETTVKIISEISLMALYDFTYFKSSSKPYLLKSIVLNSSKKELKNHLEQEIKKGEIVGRNINLARDLINFPPNELHSQEFAKRVIDEVKKFKSVKVKVLKKKEIIKEKMGCFLAVNAGSHYEPHLVHLSYTPTKQKNKSTHLALVGKGLTFDTGGYCLKTQAGMLGMKGDMGGAATVFAAFKIAVELQLPIKISCFLGMTDNMISSQAMLPDSIVRARNGKTVEILNTDAEGRLVLADVLDYACDFHPTCIVDAATLTGACVAALGQEFCGIMGNSEEKIASFIGSANKQNELICPLPIVDEFREDMKSPIADLRNIGKNTGAGAQKAAAFLEAFVKNNIPWLHLDIAGSSENQAHLPYCPAKGASGLTIRTLVDFIDGQ